ncbi:glycoside hydrolase family 88 protein [Paenibacillus sp. strain BS8-2]
MILSEFTSFALTLTGLVSAEGSYTIAYPLAVIARQRQDRELADQAFKQLMLRGDLLWDGGALCLRRQDDGTRTFRNWGRAYAWHLLGLARTYEQLHDGGLLLEEQRLSITAEWERTLSQALGGRNESHGLWDCFVGEPVTGVDTSASAGIMAAVAIARRAGLPAPVAESDWLQSTASLLRFLTPDGFMTGTAQSNKNGEALQRSGYRVISQMTMGLLGQLLGSIYRA